MPRHRLPRLAPRRLRWRLVLGFAATVALLLAALTAAERILLEQSLQRAVEQSLTTAVRLGVADLAPARKKAVESGGARASPHSGGAAMAALQITVVEQMTMPGLVLPEQLATLASTLAMPDQPVAMLDSHGTVLAAEAARLSRDRARTRPLAPDVLASLVQVAQRHARALPADGWRGRVSTPDGPYLLVLAPTQVPVVDQAQLTRLQLPLALQTQLKEAIGALAAGAMGKKDLLALLKSSKGGPNVAAVVAAQARLLHQLHPAPLVVMIARSLAETEQTLDTVTVISLAGALAVIVLATLLALLVVGTALRPLAAITAGAERLAQGDYGHRLALDAGADEVGRLAGAFDRMAAAIAVAFATQRRFVADASHELRTPLTALRGYTDVLLMGVGEQDPAVADRVLGAMQDDLGRMSRLVDDLLTLARLDGGTALQRGLLPLAGLLAAAAAEGRVLGRGRQEIVLDSVPSDLVVWGDRDRLRQVLSNVVGNACAYCPAGSRVCLRAARAGRWAAVTIEDDGPGIAPADLARLGERFFRGDAARSRRTGGSGLGLAIARGIVAAHGGTLSIDSTPGRGVTVTLRLPLVAQPSPSMPVPRTPLPMA